MSREEHPGHIILCNQANGGLRFFNILPVEAGIATAWSAEYRVAILDPEGDTVRVIERAAPCFAQDLLAVVAQDSLEVPIVEVYRFGPDPSVLPPS